MGNHALAHYCNTQMWLMVAKIQCNTLSRGFFTNEISSRFIFKRIARYMPTCNSMLCLSHLETDYLGMHMWNVKHIPLKGIH